MTPIAGPKTGAEPALTGGLAAYLSSLKCVGWDGRIRTYGTLYQKQLPYHLATSQRVGVISPECGGVQYLSGEKVGRISEFIFDPRLGRRRLCLIGGVQRLYAVGGNLTPPNIALLRQNLIARKGTRGRTPAVSSAAGARGMPCANAVSPRSRSKWHRRGHRPQRPRVL